MTDERFTIYLNAQGRPVQRALRDMTADEVLAAIDWHRYETYRLEQLADTLGSSDHAAAVERGEITAEEGYARAAYVVTIAEAFAAAAARTGRLCCAVNAILPEHAKDMPTLRALRRYWPYGQHAA